MTVCASMHNSSTYTNTFGKIHKNTFSQAKNPPHTHRERMKKIQRWRGVFARGKVNKYKKYRLKYMAREKSEKKRSFS